MHKLLPLAVATALFAPLSQAANPPAKPMPADPGPGLSLDQIVARNAAARGGAAAWERVRTLSLSGQIDAGKRRPDGGRPGIANPFLARAEARDFLEKVARGQATAPSEETIELPFSAQFERPLKTRIEIQFQGQTAVQVFDGTNGWKLRPFLGRHEVEAFTPEERRIAASQQQLDGPLINHAAKGNQVALEGTEMLEGRKNYRLRITLKDGEVRHLWIDAATFLDTKLEGAPRRVDGHERTVATWFRDYQPADGLMVARTLETSVAGVRGTEKIHVEQVAVNPPIDDSRFARPQ